MRLSAVIEEKKKKTVAGKGIDMHPANCTYFILATMKHYQQKLVHLLICNTEQ